MFCIWTVYFSAIIKHARSTGVFHIRSASLVCDIHVDFIHKITRIYFALVKPTPLQDLHGIEIDVKSYRYL